MRKIIVSIDSSLNGDVANDCPLYQFLTVANRASCVAAVGTSEIVADLAEFGPGAAVDEWVRSPHQRAAIQRYGVQRRS